MTIYDLGFLAALAADPARAASGGERQATDAARRALTSADGVVVRLGGRSGRLGECVVGTALLEGALRALGVLGKHTTPVRIVVDADAAGLFDASGYETAYWPGFAVLPATSGDAEDGIAWALDTLERARRPTVLDLHGGHDGMPEFRLEDHFSDGDRTMPDSVATLASLFRVGVRGYAVRGPLRRYADFVEDLVGLPRGAIDGRAAQPRLRLSPTDFARYPALANRVGLRADATLIVGFFQSVVAAKCYTRWDETLAQLCERVAAVAPGARLDILIACGPDDDAMPVGVTRSELTATFGAFRGTHDNARVVVTAIPSLRDLAALVARAGLVLADDTGPGHIAGALGVSTVTPYLPGNVYSRQVWSSSLFHHGVTLEPSPYTFEQIRDAVLWDSTHVIDSIPPGAIVDEALPLLLNHLTQR